MRAATFSLLAALAGLLAVPVGAAAEGVPAACPGDPINVTKVVTGSFGTDSQGSYVLVPVDVPAGTTSVRVKYCYDQPAVDSGQKHTLDLGMYEPLAGGNTVPGVDEFRGWGGSSHPDVTITPQGFSTEAEYKAKPKGHVPGRTTRGYLPGPIPAGRWNAELGVAAVVPQTAGDLDGRVAWRVEVELSSDPAFAAAPYKAAAYDEKPAKGAGWYQGDLHVHAEHSALGDATNTETFDYAFGAGGAGLDFITLTDYVTPSGWGEIGRYQSRYKGKLIARSAEVITYRGHTGNHVSGRYVDYRTGTVRGLNDAGGTQVVRGPVPPRSLFDQVHEAGGFTQVNHPTIFPSETPGNANLCRGCPWDYSDAETDWRKVDSIEVNTGPSAFGTGAASIQNPFTTTAISEWDGLRKRGFPISAAGVSDSHKAGRVESATGSPIGNARTVVYADELSEDGVRRAVQAGHAYVKMVKGAPELRFEATAADRVAIMGDNLPGDTALFTAEVRGGDGMRLRVFRDGEAIDSVPIEGASFTRDFRANSRGEYRLQVEQGAVVVALSNPIGVGAAPRLAPAGIAAGGGKAALRLRATPKRLSAGKTLKTRFLVRSNGGAPLAGIRVKAGGKSAITDSRGVAWIALKPGRSAKSVTATATARSWKSAKLKIAVRR